MADLIVEDGSGVDGANTFATEQEAIDYALERGNRVFTDEIRAKECLILAMDYLNSIDDWKGYKVDPESFVPFPRNGIAFYSVMGSPGHIEYYPYDKVPANVKTAQIEIAIAVAEGVIVFNNTGKPVSTEAQLKKRKVGPLEREYFAPGMPTVEPFNLPHVDSLLKPFRIAVPALRTYRA